MSHCLKVVYVNNCFKRWRQLSVRHFTMSYKRNKSGNSIICIGYLPIQTRDIVCIIVGFYWMVLNNSQTYLTTIKNYMLSPHHYLCSIPFKYRDCANINIAQRELCISKMYKSETAVFPFTSVIYEVVYEYYS